MRFLGIDYGSRKVGIALSDEGNTFALPHKVVPAGPSVAHNVIQIINRNDVGTIILGESKNFKGADNKIMKKIEAFKNELETRSGKPVIYEPEFLTSRQARQIQGETAMHDASAAALILQSYLDRQKNKGGK